MNFYSEDFPLPELLSEIDIFLNNNNIEDINISLSNDEFNSIILKIPVNNNIDQEELFNYFEEKNANRYYIITTYRPSLDEFELKKYHIPHSRLNEFLFYVNDPDYDETIISIVPIEEG